MTFFIEKIIKVHQSRQGYYGTSQTHHMYSTLKPRAFHVLSTWNTRGMSVGIGFYRAKVEKIEPLAFEPVQSILIYEKPRYVKQKFFKGI